MINAFARCRDRDAQGIILLSPVTMLTGEAMASDGEVFKGSHDIGAKALRVKTRCTETYYKMRFPPPTTTVQPRDKRPLFQAGRIEVRR